jgi:hypothetical protein
MIDTCDLHCATHFIIGVPRWTRLCMVSWIRSVPCARLTVTHTHCLDLYPQGFGRDNPTQFTEELGITGTHIIYKATVEGVSMLQH